MDEEAQYVLQTYARPNVVFVSGEGAKLYDADGKEYLDMTAGKDSAIVVEALSVLWLYWRNLITCNNGIMEQVAFESWYSSCGV